MEKKHKNLINISIVLSIFILVPLIVFFLGKSLGLFEYAKEGQTRSVVTLGGIKVTILNDSEDNLDLINGYPIPDSEGLLRNPIEFNIENAGTQKALDITLKLVNDTEAQDNCVIEGTNTPCTALSANKIRYAYKINNGSYSTPANLGENNNIIFNDLIDPQEVMKVSLVIWIDKEAGNEIQGSYFYGNLVITGEKSDSCGDTLCENTTFADYMKQQDQAIVGEYITLNTPRGGSNPNSYSGLGIYDDWLASFIRPIEYMKIYARRFSQSAAYPDALNLAEWTNFTYPIGTNTLIPEYLDSLVYAQSNHHINMWLASIGLEPWTGKGLCLTGLYVPEGVKFMVKGNYPEQGYARFNMVETDGTIYMPNFANSYNWLNKAYNNNGFVQNSGGANRQTWFTLVYDVDLYKEYLETCDRSVFQGLSLGGLYVLAETNVPKHKNH